MVLCFAPIAFFAYSSSEYIFTVLLLPSIIICLFCTLCVAILDSCNATRKYIEEGKDQAGKGYDPRKLLKPGCEAIKAKVIEKMELFGSVGKAE